MPFQSTPVGSSALGALPSNPAACLRVGVWDKTWDNTENFSAARRPAVSVLSLGQNRANARTLKRPNGSKDQQIRRLDARCEKRIVASSFASSYFRRSQVVQIIHERRNRCRRLYIRQPKQLSVAIYQGHALGRLSACYQSCHRQGALVESMRQAHKSK